MRNREKYFKKKLGIERAIPLKNLAAIYVVFRFRTQISKYPTQKEINFGKEADKGRTKGRICFIKSKVSKIKQS